MIPASGTATPTTTLGYFNQNSVAWEGDAPKIEGPPRHLINPTRETTYETRGKEGMREFLVIRLQATLQTTE
jgi:hypothetical protein